MKITLKEKRNIEFYFLLIALGALQAYRYNCIDLGYIRIINLSNEDVEYY